jgi:hypothetical protein
MTIGLAYPILFRILATIFPGKINEEWDRLETHFHWKDEI